MNNPITLIADRPDERLDIFVARKLPDLSRSRVQKLIDDGNIRLTDGHPEGHQKASFRLAEGTQVNITLPPPAPSHIAAQSIPLQIIFENQDIILIDKPAGMTVHPAPGHRDGTLVNAVLAHAPNIEGVGGIQRPGLVHRLDKDTTGLIVLAKNDKAFAHLANQFKTHEVKKTYIALVHGHPNPTEAVIDAPIGRSKRDRKRMAVVEDGREARTTYRVTQKYRGYSLIEASPITGRTHQIRVHLASVGHHVAGDATYGRPTSGLQRQFLHAARLSFHLPSTDEVTTFTSPLPPDLAGFLETLEPR
ncbi:MAG: RluA family pseudouridine synthase [Chloroflexi bacterium]|nr:RluA family pseudouridine synthase [Chloroflexota bacterium]